MSWRIAPAALAYAALLAYASLYPLAGWSDPGGSPFAFLATDGAAPVRRLDNLINVMAYVPLGLLLGLCLKGLRSIALQVIAASLLGVALSFTMESLQHFVPGRIPSPADLATNAGGSLLGALLAAAIRPDWSIGAALDRMRNRWLRPGGHFALGVAPVAAWALSQWMPLIPSLDPGQARESLAPLLGVLREPQAFDFLRWGAYALSLAGLALLARLVGTPGRPVVTLFFCFAAAVLAFKVPMIGRQLSAEAIAGLLAAALLAPLWLALRMRTLAGIAALLIAAGFACAHLLVEPGSAAHLSSWNPLRGPIDHPVLGLGSVFEILWAPAALGFLARIVAPRESRAMVACAGGPLLAVLLGALPLGQHAIPIATALLMGAAWTLFGLLLPEPAPQSRSRRAPGGAVAMALVLLLAASGWNEVEAATLRVGPQHPYRTPSEAAKAARDGDIIEIEAGLYPADAAIWTQHNLTIRGIGGFAHLRADGAHAEGKAIWVIKGNNTTVERIEFSGARVEDRNGAGIRQEGAGLVVRHCYFHHNQNGILTGVNLESEIVIEHSEFAHNFRPGGHNHNLYIGTVKRFTLRHSYVHGAIGGHNVKSRALGNVIEHNRIMDGQEGRSSYAIDLPDGGFSRVVGNLLQQGPRNQNRRMLAYGAEGYRNPSRTLIVANNSFVNDDPTGGTLIFVRPGAQVEATGNVLSGVGELLGGDNAHVSRSAQ